MPESDLTFDGASRRILHVMAALAGRVALAAWAGWGWKAGAGFLFGAIISWVNFRLLRSSVMRLEARVRAAAASSLAFAFLFWPAAPMLS